MTLSAHLGQTQTVCWQVGHPERGGSCATELSQDTKFNILLRAMGDKQHLKLLQGVESSAVMTHRQSQV